MNATKVKKMLQDLGLTDSESRVYYAMLELGPESVQNIAKKSGVSRTAAYEIIDSLQDKGIASTFQKGKKNYFSAEDPDHLQAYFKSRVNTMKDQLSSFKRILPELRLMQEGDKPTVRYYSSIAGLEALFRDVTTVKTDEVLEFADPTQVYDVLDEDTLLQLRSKPAFKKLPFRSLGRGQIKNFRPNSKYRVAKMGHFPGVVWIYSNRVAFTSLKGEIEVVIIESSVYADTMRALFETAWKQGEKASQG